MKMVLRKGKCLFSCLLVIALITAQNSQLYAAGSLANGEKFTEDGLEYEVVRDFLDPPKVQLLGPAAGTDVAGDLVIPGQVVHEGITYDVIWIEYDAFQDCKELTSVRILDGVESISFGSERDVGAFARCSNLKTVELPDSMERIGYYAFQDCINLTSIKMPASASAIRSQAFVGCKSLTSIEIPDGVSEIEASTFNGCSSLAYIKLPDSVKRIENAAFMGCNSLTSIVIPRNCTIDDFAFGGCVNLMTVEMYDSASMKDGAFFDCYRLGTLKLHIRSADDTVVRTVACTGQPFKCFRALEVERNLVFLTEDGTQQLSAETKPTLSAAQTAYRQAADGNTTDNLWYTWKLDSPGFASHEVDIRIKKDNALWDDHGKQFCLSRDGSTFINNLTAVEDGTYRIYESMASGNVDTGEKVTVNGADTEAEINYYTVTFYDGQDAYANGTNWEPQIVLAGKPVQAPTAAPSKTDHTFHQWVCEEDGENAYEFGDAITDTTSIYASWLPVVAEEHIIQASAGEGGRISPDGIVHVPDKAEQIFTITPQKGYHICSVTVDGVEQGTVSRYVFMDVQADHEISVFFEAVDSSTDTEEPGNSTDTEEPDKPVDTEEPDEPAGTEEPANPVETEAPDESDSTEEPANPIDTEEPTTSVSTEASENSMETEKTDHSENINASQESTEISTIAVSNASSHKNSGPGTGDQFQMEFYATVAMISGFAYLMMYFTDSREDMSEEEKTNRVAAWIRWGKQGGSLRRYVALVVIFFLLLYYYQQTRVHRIKNTV